MYNGHGSDKNKTPRTLAEKRLKKLGSVNGTPLMGRQDLPSAESDEEEVELERESERRRKLYAPRASSPASAVVHRSGREDEQSSYTTSSHTSSPYTIPYASSPYASSPLRGSSSASVSEPYVEAPVIPPVFPSPVIPPIFPSLVISPVIPSPVISPVAPPVSMEDYAAYTARVPHVDRSPSISSSSYYQGEEPVIPKSISKRREQAYAASPLRNGSVSGTDSRHVESAAPRGQQYTQDQRYGENSSGVTPPRRPHDVLDTPVQSMNIRRPDSNVFASPSSSSHRDRQRRGDANDLNGLMDSLSLSLSGHSSSSSRTITPGPSTYHVRNSSTNAPRRRESANTSTPRESQKNQVRYQSQSSSKAPSHGHERW